MTKPRSPVEKPVEPLAEIMGYIGHVLGGFLQFLVWVGVSLAIEWITHQIHDYDLAKPFAETVLDAVAGVLLVVDGCLLVWHLIRPAVLSIWNIRKRTGP